MDLLKAELRLNPKNLSQKMSGRHIFTEVLRRGKCSGIHLYFNKQSLPKDQKSKTSTLTGLADPVACRRKQALVVHALNPRTREDYKVGGDSSQSHSEIPGGRITIFRLRSR